MLNATTCESSRGSTPWPTGYCMHESSERRTSEGRDEGDKPRRGQALIDAGFHPPTVSRSIVEALMVEPTETESELWTGSSRPWRPSLRKRAKRAEAFHDLRTTRSPDPTRPPRPENPYSPGSRPGRPEEERPEPVDAVLSTRTRPARRPVFRGGRHDVRSRGLGGARARRPPSWRPPGA